MPKIERWRRSGRQIAFRDIELVDFGAKPRCLEFLVKAGLDRIPVDDGHVIPAKDNSLAKTGLHIEADGKRPKGELEASLLDLN